MYDVRIFSPRTVSLQNAGVYQMTALVALAAALWRFAVIAPLDTLKTAHQVQGNEAGKILTAPLYG